MWTKGMNGKLRQEWWMSQSVKFPVNPIKHLFSSSSPQNTLHLVIVSVALHAGLLQLFVICLYHLAFLRKGPECSSFIALHVPWSPLIGTLVNVKIDFGLLVFRSLNVFAAQLISNKLKFVTNRSPWSFKPVLTVRTEQLWGCTVPALEQPAEDIRLSEELFTEDAFFRSKTDVVQWNQTKSKQSKAWMECVYIYGTHTNTHIYMHIYIERERERERDVTFRDAPIAIFLADTDFFLTVFLLRTIVDSKYKQKSILF